MSLEIGTAKRLTFERTPQERVTYLVGIILDAIDEPSACKNTETGRYSSLAIHYLEAARDPEGEVREGLLQTLADLNLFPESQCLIGVGEGSDVLKNGDRVILTSTASGNRLYEQEISSPDGLLWGYQYWINNKAAELATSLVDLA